MGRAKASKTERGETRGLKVSIFGGNLAVKGLIGRFSRIFVSGYVLSLVFLGKMRSLRTTTATPRKNLYFTYLSRDTLTSFVLFITLETIAKQNPEHSDKLK